jgi:hypothetical protein
MLACELIHRQFKLILLLKKIKLILTLVISTGTKVALAAIRVGSTQFDAPCDQICNEDVV